jgi:hypothetical protein
VRDGVNLPAIAAFRLLAAKLKHLGRNNPILLKDCLGTSHSSPNTGHPERSDASVARVAQSKDLANDPDASAFSPPFAQSAGFNPAHRELSGGPSTPLRSGRDDTHLFGSGILEPKIALLRTSVVIGSLLADGIGDAILVRGEAGAGQSLRLAYNILQAAGCRSFKTDYVACPSCGRTLFNLQETTARIKASTEHLKGVKIAIMGCIVNGPGEMADADFGYVGGAPGKVNLYVGKTPVKFNIPEAEAVERLKDLIREHGKWVDPASV